MIELDRDIEQGDTQVWADAEFRHVIVLETEDIVRYDARPGWYVRDEDVFERGPYQTLADALTVAQNAWGDVTLAPANRLRRDITEGRADEVEQFLLEYLADYGAVGIDVQALANLVFTRIEEE